MKITQLVKTAAFLVAIALAAPSAFAITAAQKNAVKKAVTSVPVPEMPAKAAAIVLKASAEDREATAVEVVKAAIYKNRTVAAAVVAAVSKAAPDVAPAVTLAATQMERDQVSAIATAAATAAPGSRTEINASANLGVQMSAPMAISSGTSMAVASLTPSVASSAFSSSPFLFREARESFATVTGVSVTTSPNSINGTPGFTGYIGNQAGPSTKINYTLPRE